MSRVVSRSSGIPVFSATAIQISGTSTPSMSSVTIVCFTRGCFQDSEVLSSQPETGSRNGLTRHFFDDFPRVLIVAQAEKNRLPQMTIAGPFSKTDLTHQQ